MKKWYCVVTAGALLAFASKAYAHHLNGAPEIDPGSAASAIGVLGGVIALAAEKLRRR